MAHHQPEFTPVAATDSISEALAALSTSSSDPLPPLIHLFDALRPARASDRAEALRRWQRMLHLLEIPSYYDGLRSALLTLFAQRRQYRLYTESGLLPNTGFFSELRRKLAHRLLPELIDPDDLRDCIRLIFHRPSDAIWMKDIPLEDQISFWRLLTPLSRRILGQIAEAARVLSQRICAMGLEPELLRVVSVLRDTEHSPFLALIDEMTEFLARLDDEEQTVGEVDKRHLLVLIEQCRAVVQQAHRQATATAGTSMSLTFQLTRLAQHLKRLELMIEVLAVKVETLPEEEVVVRWSTFMADVCQQELERNSLRRHFADLLGRVSLLVTENAARTGEHYIADNRQQWWGILRAAGGAGLLIAVMALLKLIGYNLHLPVLSQGLLNGLIYGGGFALVHLLHFIIATKQPAMTAAAIAGTISQSSGRLREQGRLVELMVATARSQFAAIMGNVSVAFPVALVIGALTLLAGHDPVSPEKAHILLQEVQPFSTLSLAYAAVAGVWLFVTGLVSGYVDNLAAYGQVGPRIAGLGWLRRLAGSARADRVGSYVSSNAGGLMGNLFFGMMLGLTPAVGAMLGLPLDIRHVAFSSANIGYALTALEFSVRLKLAASAVLGVALIGLVNLVVSFTLALWVAMRSRGARFSSALSLLPLLRQRLFSTPRAFFLPEREPPQEPPQPS